MSEGEATNAAKPEPRIGSYKLLHSLGSGGMSSVFKAVHIESGLEVALKVLPRTLAKNSTLLQRFLREAKSAESLEHPHIVSIFDRGVDNGRHYLVLEFVEGGDLHDRVRNQGPLPIGEAVNVIRTVSEGLQFASSRGLIHRDIKPANLLMTPTGEVKIIDLGLALQADEDDERVTREGTTVGTVDFMSPEQARDSRATNERSDIYSLGCTFYYLLTGAPPFPGGDVADKLSRHCLQAPPDVRLLRSEVSTPLALLIRKMMAKRPENRFKDYQELIDELDALPAKEAQKGTGEEPLFAVFDDEDEDGSLPLMPADGPGPTLFALVDDEAKSSPVDDLPLIELSPLSSPSTELRTNRSRPAAQVSFAELAALSGDDSADASIPRTNPATAPSRSRRGGAAPVQEAPVISALMEDEEALEALAGSNSLGGPRRYDDGSRQWITKWSLVGLGVICLVIGIHQLVRTATSSSEAVPEVVETVEASPTSTTEPEPHPPAAPVSTPPKVAIVPKNHREVLKKAAETKPAAASTWKEPIDLKREVFVETTFAPEQETKFLPEWAKAPIPDRLPGNFALVRRVPDPKDTTQHPTLRLAFDVIGGTVEIADNGPFFEDDLRVAGESRLIKARSGFRPVICVDDSQKLLVREQPAVFVLDGKNLILDGVDLIVDVKKLPHTQTALFLSRGGSLTLRNCTITVVNARGTPFSVIRTGDPARPGRLRLESTLIRGGPCTLLELGGGSWEAVVNRSVLLGSREPLIACKKAEPNSERKVSFLRSVLGARGPVFDVSETPTASGRKSSLAVASFGTIYGRFDGPGSASLMIAPSGDRPTGEVLAWSGDFNQYAGWRDWMVGEGSRTVKLANLAAVRSLWPASDQHSQERQAPWTALPTVDRLLPSDFDAIESDFKPTLSKVALPTPFLFEKTIGAFGPIVIPQLAPPPPSVAQAALANGGRPVMNAATPESADASREAMAKRMGFPVLSKGSAPPTPKPAPTPKAAPPRSTPAVPSETREVFFDIADARWQGNLGKFLQDEIHQGDRRVRVRVRGAGQRTCTPVRIPKGVSLEILPERPTTRGGAPVAWAAAYGASGEALIDVRDADLVLTEVRLTRDGSAHLKSLVRVDNGHLVLNRCWLLSAGQLEPGGGGLISFNAASTQPLARGTSPFEFAPDRPFCRLIDSLLITAGDAIFAEIGRGSIALTQCAIAGGSSAFSLAPAKVARERFDATLSLENCTVAGEKSFISLATWPGESLGPNRPLLVLSHNSAFTSGYEHGARDAVLLRVEPDSLDHGLLFWQSSNDAFDVSVFTARSDSILPPNRFADVHRQWVELWGSGHVHSVTGSTRNGSNTNFSTRFYERLRSNGVAPGDLALDTSYHPGRTRLDVGADLSRLQILVKRPQRGVQRPR